MAFLDKTGLVRLWEHINSKIENKVEKEADKGLILTSEAERLSTVITGLEITDDVENLEGVNIIQNAHTLGGIAADQYALKSDLENLPDSNIGTITNINGIEPDENGTVILHANDVKAVTINLEETNEGEPVLTNADMLGGITADQYALKGAMVTSFNGQTGDIVFEGGGISTEFVGATAEADGAAGAVPAPVAGEQDKYLCADGSWSDIILPGEETTTETIGSMDIHVDTADTAYNAEKLGGITAEEYATKDHVTQAITDALNSIRLASEVSF